MVLPSIRVAKLVKPNNANIPKPQLPHPINILGTAGKRFEALRECNEISLLYTEVNNKPRHIAYKIVRKSPIDPDSACITDTVCSK